MKTKLKVSMLWIILVVSSAPLTGHALSYQEKKDNDALSAMERALKRTPMQTRLFDGKQIPPGTNPVDVRLHLNQVQTALRSAKSSWKNVSNAGRSSAKAKELVEQYNAYQAYATGLSKAYDQLKARPSPSSQAVQPRQTVVVTTTDGSSQRTEALRRTCMKFRQQLSPLDRRKIRFLADVDNGQKLFLQNRNEVIDHRESNQAVAKLCSAPEYNNIQTACQALTSAGTAPEGTYCAAAAKGESVLQTAVLNYAAFLARQHGSATDVSIDTLKKQDGWVKYEGAVSWSTVVSGGRLPDVISKRLKPLFAEVGLQNAEDAEVLADLNANANKLAHAIETLAPSWRMPGDECQGSACGVAKQTLQTWYPKGKILRVSQKEADWRIRQHEVTGVPIERYRSGWTLIEVADDPYCQLRSWTVYEKYQGGGKYESADRAQIGYVRWQNCS